MFSDFVLEWFIHKNVACESSVTETTRNVISIILENNFFWGTFLPQPSTSPTLALARCCAGSSSHAGVGALARC